MKVLAKFRWNCGRMGEVEGLFVCERSKLEDAYGKRVYFGEILGKHSEVHGTLDEKDITIKTDDQDFIAQLVAINDGSRISGYCPLDYLSDDEEDEEEDEDE